MHVGIVVAAWAFALALALVVLGSLTYEVVWKVRRLQSEQVSLLDLVARLTSVGSDLQTAGERAARLRAPAPE